MMYWRLLLLAALTTLLACGSDDDDLTPDDIPGSIDWYAAEFYDDDCFEFVYPISLTLPNDSVVILTDDDDWEDIANYYITSPDADEDPAIDFPVMVELEDPDSLATLQNEAELIALIETCELDDDDDEWEYDDFYDDDCFEFVYPLTVMLPDGSTLTLSNDDDWENVEDWYEDNDSGDDPMLQYPVQVELEDDDQIITVNTLLELEALYEDCDDDDDEWDDDDFYDDDCFEFVYPITVILPDGSTLTLSDDDHWDNVEDWYEDNDSDDDPTLHYPVQVELEDGGGNQTLNSDADLEALNDSCD